MVGDSVQFLKSEGLRVFFDAEHFFDGYKRNPEFALRVLEAAAVQGADCLVLCDTNGGSLPHEVEMSFDTLKVFRLECTPKMTPGAQLPMPLLELLRVLPTCKEQLMATANELAIATIRF